MKRLIKYLKVISIISLFSWFMGIPTLMVKDSTYGQFPHKPVASEKKVVPLSIKDAVYYVTQEAADHPQEVF